MRSFFLVIAAHVACAEPTTPKEPPSHERVVGLPCDGCELVFVGMPTSIASEARIAPATADGEPLVITGVVTRGGIAVPGIVVYAYQTDAGGVYPNSGSASRHGEYRGWATSDGEGRYRFRTIRPGSYPRPNAPPEHIHMHVLEPGRCTYYIADIEFVNDPRASVADTARGGRAASKPERIDGIWNVRRDISLGLNVPGYSRCL